MDWEGPPNHYFKDFKLHVIHLTYLESNKYILLIE
jgi:hypothetical protein